MGDDALCFADREFRRKHPTIKMLALAFLLLIGFTLVAEGFHQHIPKGYIYGAMAFFGLWSTAQFGIRRKGKPVYLHEAYTEDDKPPPSAKFNSEINFTKIIIR